MCINGISIVIVMWRFIGLFGMMMSATVSSFSRNNRVLVINSSKSKSCSSAPCFMLMKERSRYFNAHHDPQCNHNNNSFRRSSRRTFLTTTTYSARRSSDYTIENNHDGKLYEQNDENSNNKQECRIAIVGGGLAGLSTAYHYLSKVVVTKQEQKQHHHVTIFDTKSVGAGGASSVAGGLLHPLSPNGKLVHWGMEGLLSTNQLLSAAVNASTPAGAIAKDEIILRDELFRLVVSDSRSTNDDTTTSSSTAWTNANHKTKKMDQQISQMKSIAMEYSNMIEWFDHSSVDNSAIQSLLAPSSLSSIPKDELRGSEENEQIATTTSSNTSAPSSTASVNTSTTTDRVLGGLRLFNGCKVIHVPSYLRGLFMACQEIDRSSSSSNNQTCSIDWCPVPSDEKFDGSSIQENRKSSDNNDSMSVSDQPKNNNDSTIIQFWKNELDSYDIVVFAAGSGMFATTTRTSSTNGTNYDNQKDSSSIQQDIQDDSTNIRSIFDKSMLPIQLVTGQSIVLKKNNSCNENVIMTPFPALLAGKYISPMPDVTKILIGATHEYKSNPLTAEEVISELKKRTYPMAPQVWDVDDDSDDVSVDEITLGIRVQSERSTYGRMPIIGRLDSKQRHYQDSVNRTCLDVDDANAECSSLMGMIHPNAWIFTGLSSRGLLYHSLYGDILTDAIISNDEEIITSRCKDLLWWKMKSPKTRK